MQKRARRMVSDLRHPILHSAFYLLPSESSGCFAFTDGYRNPECDATTQRALRISIGSCT